MRNMFAVMAIMLCVCAVCSAQGVGLTQGVKAEKPAYLLGGKILFQYVISNNSRQALTYNFSSAKQCDVWVARGEQEVFRLSANKAYAQVLTSLTLKPGDTRTFCAEWNQKDSSNKQVGPGSYTIYAQLTPTGAKPPQTSGHVQIGIRGAVLVPVTIKDALSTFDALSGKKVTISAVFKGWSPNLNDANTNDGPPVTRSDWAICDETGCMYVVGKTDLDPTKDSGKKIIVIGKLAKTSKGQVYMMLGSMTLDKTCVTKAK